MHSCSQVSVSHFILPFKVVIGKIVSTSYSQFISGFQLVWYYIWRRTPKRRKHVIRLDLELWYIPLILYRQVCLLCDKWPREYPGNSFEQSLWNNCLTFWLFTGSLFIWTYILIFCDYAFQKNLWKEMFNFLFVPSNIDNS